MVAKGEEEMKAVAEWKQILKNLWRLKWCALSGIIMLFLVGVLVWQIAWPLPAPATVTFDIVTGATILPAEKVYPGTFRIEIPVKDLVSRQDQNTIITYGVDEYGYNVRIEYWVPFRSGIFYHSEKIIPNSYPLRPYAMITHKDNSPILVINRTWIGNGVSSVLFVLIIMFIIANTIIFCSCVNDARKR